MPLGSAKVGLFGAAGATAAGGQRGVFWASNTGSVTNVIQYITINSAGDATDFGDTTEKMGDTGCTSNGGDDRGVSAGGYNAISDTSNVIEYITISTPGNATDFGDLTYRTQYGRYAPATVSNGTNDRGVWMGGANVQSPYYYNTIDYVTISSTGDAADFGDMTDQFHEAAAMCNGTDERGISFAGYKDAPGAAETDVIEYITINSAGDSTDFGDALGAKAYMGGCSNDTSDRGIAAGGYKTADSPRRHNVIQYITITSTGNATDFGDLTTVLAQTSGLSNGTGERGVFGGGANDASGTKQDVIQYITINSTGNSADFGDLLAVQSAGGTTGLSDAAE